MVTLRVIYTPDERENSFPKCKKIEGKDPFDALLNFAKLYDVEVNENIIEDQAFLDLIDLLTDDGRVNLSFVQNAETGETYHDIAFQ